MLHKLLKSLLVIGSTVSVSALLGIISFGRIFDSLIPDSFTILVYPGMALSVIGLLLSLASSIFILKYFVFFTHTEVLDSEGNTLTDNQSLTVGSVSLPPILIAAAGVLLSMVLIGAGFAMMLDIVTMYIVYLLTIAFLMLMIGLIIFLFSVIKHKIRRRFAWIAAGIFGLIALVMVMFSVPAISDLSVKESELSAITATVVQTSPHTGILAGPGRSIIRIKGTSGEMITLQFSGNRNAFRVGKKYTFYYLPKTHLIKKVNPADKIQY